MKLTKRRNCALRRLALEPLESRVVLDATMLLDLNATPVAGHSYPRMFQEIDDEVYFLTSDIVGDELWKTDGQTVEKLLDFGPDFELSEPDLAFHPGGLRKVDSFEPWDAGLRIQSGALNFYFDGDSNVRLAGEILGKVDDWFFHVERFGSANSLIRVDSDGQTPLLRNSFAAPVAGPATSDFAILNDRILMAHAHGLGITDGTKEGSVWLAGGAQEPPLLPFAFQQAGEDVYFFSTSDDFRLWATDGTGSGTRSVDTIVDFDEADFRVPTVARTLTSNDELYFVLQWDDGRLPQLWRSGGTAEETLHLMGIRHDSELRSPVEFGDLLLFANIAFAARTVGEDRVPVGGDLIVTDGTAGGTHKIVTDQVVLHNEPQITVIADTAFFVAFTEDAGFELWATDGTDAGTRLVRDINAGTTSSNISDLRVISDQVMFVADSENGRELWVSDGTADGTRMFVDIEPGAGSSNPTGFRILNDQLLFLANTSQHGQELWTTDGTAEGTRLVRDINVGAGNSEPAEFVEFNGELVFSAYSQSLGSELWVTDGTTDGTRLLFDLSPGPASATPNNLSPIGERLYFSAQGDGMGFEPWVTDGTLEGSRLIENIVAEGTDSSLPRELTIVGDQIFFSADDGIHGQELWVTDGTAEGTRLVRDIAEGPRGSDINDITAIGDQIFFAASDETHGRELWVSDGTEPGTMMIADVVPGLAGSSPARFTAAGDDVYFTAFDFDHGEELWVTDGTPDGTRMVVDALPGENDSVPHNLTYFDGQLYFVASVYNAHFDAVLPSLWLTDGSLDGTRLVDSEFLDCLPANSSFFPEPSWFTVVNGELFFLACSRLAKLDHNRVIPIPLRDRLHSFHLHWILPNDESIVAFGGDQEFFEYDPRRDVFRVFATDFEEPQMIPFDQQIAILGDSVFFETEQYSDGGFSNSGLRRLPRNGTWASTLRGADGLMNGVPFLFEVIDDAIYLVADHDELGRELWRSDGTTDGTFVVTNIAPLANDSHPSQIVRLGDRIVFRADDQTTGSELWTMDLPQSKLEFAAAEFQVHEDGSVAGDEIVVRRSGSLDEAIEFTVRYVADPRISDFDVPSQTYQLEVGQSTITIPPPPIVQDELIEDDARWRMRLVVSSTSGTATTVHSESTLVIVDDDRILGDVDGNGRIQPADLDDLVSAIVAANVDVESTPTGFTDLNSDQALDVEDIRLWLEIAGRIFSPTGEPFRMGDANLDGDVDGEDWRLLFQYHPRWAGGRWSEGRDFNADGANDVSDFNIWNDNRFRGEPAVVRRMARPPRAPLSKPSAVANDDALSVPRQPDPAVSDRGSVDHTSMTDVPRLLANRRPSRQLTGLYRRSPLRHEMFDADDLATIECVFTQLGVSWNCSFRQWSLAVIAD